eukprot:RCo010332
MVHSKRVRAKRARLAAKAAKAAKDAAKPKGAKGTSPTQSKGSGKHVKNPKDRSDAAARASPKSKDGSSPASSAKAAPRLTGKVCLHCRRDFTVGLFSPSYPKVRAARPSRKARQLEVEFPTAEDAAAAHAEGKKTVLGVPVSVGPPLPGTGETALLISGFKVLTRALQKELKPHGVQSVAYERGHGLTAVLGPGVSLEDSADLSGEGGLPVCRVRALRRRLGKKMQKKTRRNRNQCLRTGKEWRPRARPPSSGGEQGEGHGHEGG